MRGLLSAAALAAFTVVSDGVAAGTVQRSEFTVSSSSGMKLFVREIGSLQSSGRPVILVHGARVPGIPSFDLDIPGGSLAADLAQAGYRVYVPDLGGYGLSERPAAYDAAPEANPPMMRLADALADLHAIVDEVRKRTGQDHVALFGWATGGMWSAAYAAREPTKVSHLVVLNALYGGSDEHAMLRDAPRGAWRASPAADLIGAWDRNIPLDDKAQWRDPTVRDAYVAAALASDVAGSKANPPVMRAPTGALTDSVLQAWGQKLFDASTITAHTLVVRASRDFWSRPEDAKTLQGDLRTAASYKLLELPEATHFVHLDRPERGRTALIAETLALLER